MENTEPVHDNTARSTATSKAEGRLMVMKRAVHKYKKNGKFAGDGKGGPGIISNPLGSPTMATLSSIGVKPSPNASASDAPMGIGGMTPGGVAPIISKQTKNLKSTGFRALSGARSSIKALKIKALKSAIAKAPKMSKMPAMKSPRIPFVK